MADKNFWTIHYLPSFNVALIYKISKFSFGHHCVHKSQAAKFINIWPSDTYQKNLKQSYKCINECDESHPICLVGGSSIWVVAEKLKGGMELVTVVNLYRLDLQEDDFFHSKKNV